MQNCSDCGRAIDDDFEGRGLCEDCGRKRNVSQDERRHEGDEKHGK
jgi:hypothetical protein